MALTREQAKHLCRTSMADWAILGNPTEAELDAKIAEVEGMNDDDKRRVMRRVAPPSYEDLVADIETLRVGRGDANTMTIYGMGADQSLTIGVTATVLFGSLISGASLNNLGLTLSNGIFTSTKNNNILLVSYQLRFSGEASSTGYRQGSISVGNDFYGRNQTPTLSVATHVAGSSPIMLNRNDTFSIKAFNTGTATTLIKNTDTASNATRLVIASF